MDNHTNIGAAANDLTRNNATSDRNFVDSSRPILGFPLGTVLMLLVILCISAAFSCCYHWDKIRPFIRRQRRRSPSSSEQDHDAITLENLDIKHTPIHQVLQKQQCGTLPVLMPGDKFPKFVALPSEKAPITITGTALLQPV